jgi:hypothetical protein
MPRSWPSTEAEPQGEASDRRRAPSIEIEIIDLAPDRERPPPARTPATPRRGWPFWVLIGLMVIAGIALLPGQDAEPSATTDAQVLPEPEFATTSTTLAAASQAVMSDETFSLVPASGLDGFIQFAGPVEFNGQYWIAGNSSYPSADVHILSSVDGTRWDFRTTVSADSGNWLTIDDFDSFEGVLVAIGSTGPAGPAHAPLPAASLVLWKSIDGLRWSSIPVAEEAGMLFSGLQLTIGSEEVLITGQRSNGFDAEVLAQVPPELVPGLERGDFSLWHDYSNIRIVAPPGIELFRMAAPPSPAVSRESAVLFRSDNLIIWEDLPIAFSPWNVAPTLDGGFVSNATDGLVMYSPDGRSWDRTDRFPPHFYQSWGDRLVGLDFSVSTPSLVVFRGDESAIIDLPTEIAENQYGLSITPGDSGLATILGTYDTAAAEPITRVDGYLLTMDDGVLRIEEPSGEISYANFGNDGLIKGTYVADTDSIRFENTDGSKSFEFPVAVFLDLRWRNVAGLFEVFVSDDGLEWAKPQTGLRAEYADILGSAGDTFLIALHNYAPDYRPLPITVYRTGPVG